MKNKIIYIVIAIVALATSCQKSVYLNEGDFFHLSHKGADMPVWAIGNFDSDVLLITVHGGPGDSGMEQRIAEGFQFLEEDYLLVHWDQRYSGMTQGRYDEASTMTPDQFIEDTEKIVELVKSKYPNKKMFMLGHSWGGQLSAGYLGRDNHDDLFKGWIDLDGSISGELESQLMKEWILERVPAKLAEPDADVEYWQFIIDYYEENPNPGNYSTYEPYWYVSSLRGDAYDWEAIQDRNPTPYVELIFKSMFALSWYQESFTMSRQILWDEIDYTPELKNITIPALMLWGADDGIVPAKVADYVYENLGTSPDMKKVVKIPECAHGPQHEQPEIFYQEISNFIETYK